MGQLWNEGVGECFVPKQPHELIFKSQFSIFKKFVLYFF